MIHPGPAPTTAQPLLAETRLDECS